MRNPPLSRNRRAAAAFAATLAATLLAGCGGENTRTLAPTDTYFGPMTSATVDGATLDVGRAYVKLRGDVPVEMGVELTPAVVALPTPTSTRAWVMSLPPEAARTPFAHLRVTNVPQHIIGGEPNGDMPHFHALFMRNAQRPVTAGNPNESMPVAEDEVPQGVRRTDPAYYAPGYGIFYDDPTLDLPGEQYDGAHHSRKTVGLNYAYYGGHLNGYVLGDETSMLAAKGHAEDAIPEPKVYPQAGYFPTHYKFEWNAAHGTHVLAVDGFRMRAGAAGG